MAKVKGQTTVLPMSNSAVVSRGGVKRIVGIRAVKGNNNNAFHPSQLGRPEYAEKSDTERE